MVKTVYFEVTTACPCSCEHCHIPLQLRRENPLTRSFEDLVVDVSILKDALNAENLVLSGGEPTLHKEILGIVESAAKMFKTAVISNCINPNLLKQISEKATVYASLDFYGEAQDEWRGFKGLWRNYLNIADVANIRATLLRNNISHVKKLIQTAVQHKRKITIVPCKRKSPRLTPTPQQLQQLLLYIFQNKFEKRAVIDSPEIRMWLATKNPQLMKEAQKHGSLCTACESVIRVNPQGIVFPCPFLNWKICAIHDSEIKQKIALTRQRMINTYTGKCLNCELNAVCGGCRASSNAYCFVDALT